MTPGQFPEVKKMEKVESFKWEERTDDGQSQQVRGAETTMKKSREEGDPNKEEDDQEESISKQMKMNSFLADHQREMGNQDKQGSEEETDAYHFS